MTVPTAQDRKSSPIWWLPGFVRVSQGVRPGHRAVDLSARLGSPILAPVAGTVRVGWDPKGYGRYVDILSNGKRVRLAHLQEVFVRPGQAVSPGQLIGLVGSTGRSTGPHVHLEVIEGERRLDPAELLRKARPPERLPPGAGIMVRLSIPTVGLAAARAGVQTGGELRNPATMARMLAALPPSAREIAVAQAAATQQAAIGVLDYLRDPAERLAFGALGALMMALGALMMAWGLRDEILRSAVGVIRAAGR